MAIEYGSRMGSLGEALGQGIEKAINSKLQLLQQKKLNDLAIRHGIDKLAAEKDFYKKSMEPILGSQVAGFVSGLSPKEREVVLQNLGGLMQLNGAQQPMNGLATLAQENELTQQVEPQRDTLYDKLMQLQGAEQVNPNTWGMQQTQKYPQKKQPYTGAQIGQVQPQENVQQTRNQLLQDIFTPESVKRERMKLAMKERQMSQAEKLAAFKETKAERKEISDKARAAKQNLHDLERLETLNKENKLDTPGYYAFLERSGLNIPALMNPESQEFQKISYNFMRDAKAVFGSRISNMEIENFLKTLPSLSQSSQGRARVIANLKYISRANLAYKEALKEIMQENKGIPPMDLTEQIDDRIDPKLNAISKKFKKDLEKPVPPAQNRLVTAGQAILGSAMGVPGTILGGVGKLVGKLAG